MKNYTEGIIRQECLAEMDDATRYFINEICRKFWANTERILSKPPGDQKKWKLT